MGGAKPRWHEITLAVPRPWNEVLPHILEEMGISSFWLDEEKKPPHRLILRGYLPEGLWQPNVEKQLRAHFKELCYILPERSQEAELNARLVEEEDWSSRWLSFFEPFKIGSVWIRPRQKSVHLSADEQEIILDPGQAFGTVSTNPHSYVWSVFCCFARLWKMRQPFSTWARGALSRPYLRPKSGLRRFCHWT